MLRKLAVALTLAAAPVSIGLASLGGAGAPVHSAENTGVIDTTLCGTGAVAIGLGCGPLQPLK